jgi:hypothetical protein
LGETPSGNDQLILWQLVEGGFCGWAAPALVARASVADSPPALVALVGLIGMGAIFGISSFRRRVKGGDDVRDFLRHGTNDKHREEWPMQADDGQAAAAGSPQGEPGGGGAPDFAGVGEHVTSVLAAAEAAATKLRAAAEEEAWGMIHNAERQAQETREQAREESETVRASAQQILDEAEAASSDVRAQADRYAEERRREADTQAAKAVLEAERKAASIADTSKERHRVVLSNIATSEARLRDLAKSLRGVASALDTVVGEGQEEGAPNAGSLEESLRSRTTVQNKEEVAHQ